MTETTRGLIVRTRPLTETSLIVHWLTPDQGRLATVAKGAQRPKSTFRGKLDLFYLADFSFVRSRKSELHNLREVSLIQPNSFLRKDLEALQQVSYATVLLEQTTETETPIPVLYELLLELLAFLRACSASAQALFAFELKLLDELGLTPDLAGTKLLPGTRAVIKGLADSDWNYVSLLKLTPAQEREIRQFLHGFLIYHLGRVPKLS